MFGVTLVLRTEDHSLRGGYVRWHIFHFILHEARIAEVRVRCDSFWQNESCRCFLTDEVLMSGVAVPDTCDEHSFWLKIGFLVK